MGTPLIGKKSICGFFGCGWRKVLFYIGQGAPITKGPRFNDTHEADEQMLKDWWNEYQQKRIKDIEENGKPPQSPNLMRGKKGEQVKR